MYINKIGGEIKFTADKVLPKSQPLYFSRGRATSDLQKPALGSGRSAYAHRGAQPLGL